MLRQHLRPWWRRSWRITLILSWWRGAFHPISFTQGKLFLGILIASSNFLFGLHWGSCRVMDSLLVASRVSLFEIQWKWHFGFSCRTSQSQSLISKWIATWRQPFDYLMKIHR